MNEQNKQNEQVTQKEQEHDFGVWAFALGVFSILFSLTVIGGIVFGGAALLFGVGAIGVQETPSPRLGVLGIMLGILGFAFSILTVITL